MEPISPSSCFVALLKIFLRRLRVGGFIGFRIFRGNLVPFLADLHVFQNLAADRSAGLDGELFADRVLVLCLPFLRRFAVVGWCFGCALGLLTSLDPKGRDYELVAPAEAC